VTPGLAGIVVVVAVDVGVLITGVRLAVGVAITTCVLVADGPWFPAGSVVSVGPSTSVVGCGYAIQVSEIEGYGSSVDGAPTVPVAPAACGYIVSCPIPILAIGVTVIAGDPGKSGPRHSPRTNMMDNNDAIIINMEAFCFMIKSKYNNLPGFFQLPRKIEWEDKQLYY
jgi:hypothetical protein